MEKIIDKLSNKMLSDMLKRERYSASFKAKVALEIKERSSIR